MTAHQTVQRGRKQVAQLLLGGGVAASPVVGGVQVDARIVARCHLVVQDVVGHERKAVAVARAALQVAIDERLLHVGAERG